MNQYSATISAGFGSEIHNHNKAYNLKIIKKIIKFLMKNIFPSLTTEIIKSLH